MADDDDPKRRLPAHLRALFKDGIGDKTGDLLARFQTRKQGKLKTGRIGRALELSKLAMGSGSRLLLSKARGESGAIDLAAELVETFSEMRGVTMKVGQMLSYLGTMMPPEAQRVLAILQRDAPAMAWPEVRAQLEAELGAPPESRFAEIETTPIAAASIGQVHRARLADGTQVAVKVQYPGIAEAMGADLKNARVLSIFQRMFFFRTNTQAIMEELEQRLLDECDYRKEADYEESFARRFAGHPWIVVPRVHRALSTKKVLVTDFEEGDSFYQWLAAKPDAEARARATRTFYRFYIGGFYLDGIFNCDPHPGNYLFKDDGRIVFLDYGCARRFPEERRKLWIEFNVAVFEDQPERLHDLAVKIGFYAPGVAVDLPAFRTLIRWLYEPYLIDAPYDFKQHQPEKTFRQMFIDNPNLFKLDMPADAVFLNRITFGLVSLLGEIGSTLNVRRTADAYFRGVDPDWPEDPIRPASGRE